MMTIRNWNRFIECIKVNYSGLLSRGRARRRTLHFPITQHRQFWFRIRSAQQFRHLDNVALPFALLEKLQGKPAVPLQGDVDEFLPRRAAPLIQNAKHVSKIL